MLASVVIVAVSLSPKQVFAQHKKRKTTAMIFVSRIINELCEAFPKLEWETA
jgi:hypothetical protein